MDLVKKYIGEVQYKKYDPSEYETVEDLADSWIEMAKKGLMKGMQKDINVNIAWAIKKGDKQKVKKLLDKYIQYVHGGQGSVNQLLSWIK